MIRYTASAIIVISLIMFAGLNIWAADREKPETTNESTIASKAINGKVPVDESILIDLANMPLYHIDKAREYFLDKDKKEAAANEIRITGVFLRLEAQRAASERDKEALLGAVKQLNEMAGEIDKGSISSIGEFDYNILVAGEEIAKFHTTMAEVFSSNKEIAKAGYELKAATEYTKHGYKWSDQKMEKETDEILSSGDILAGKMIAGANIVPEEMSKSIKAVNAEVNKLKKHNEKRKPTKNR